MYIYIHICVYIYVHIFNKRLWRVSCRCSHIATYKTKHTSKACIIRHTCKGACT